MVVALAYAVLLAVVLAWRFVAPPRRRDALSPRAWLVLADEPAPARPALPRPAPSARPIIAAAATAAVIAAAPYLLDQSHTPDWGRAAAPVRLDPGPAAGGRTAPWAALRVELPVFQLAGGEMIGFARAGRTLDFTVSADADAAPVWRLAPEAGSDLSFT
jgi:hypothetical protein